MTTLGINTTDREPVTGWEAIHPKSQPFCELVVRLAEDRLAEAWEQYDQLLEKFHGENPVGRFGGLFGFASSASSAMTWPEYMVAKDKLFQAIEYAKTERENACSSRAAYYQYQAQLAKEEK